MVMILSKKYKECKIIFNHGKIEIYNPNNKNINYIQEAISYCENKHKLPCVYFSSNPQQVDNKKIFYGNFCWDLYKGTEPPLYDFNDLKYSFTYLCGFPREDKLHMLSQLYMNDLLEDSLWSCGSIQKESNIPLPDLPKIIDYDKRKKGIRSCWEQIKPDFYRFSPFSLVQETEMQKQNSRYTEKTYKCFWMKHPFIVAGNYNVLKTLKDDGFKTFHPYIDETYDSIEGRDERMTEIIKQVKILCSKTKEEWKNFFKDIGSILDYNYTHCQNIKLNDNP